jgi:hypothetical protein
LQGLAREVTEHLHDVLLVSAGNASHAAWTGTLAVLCSARYPQLQRASQRSVLQQLLVQYYADFASARDVPKGNTGTERLVAANKVLVAKLWGLYEFDASIEEASKALLEANFKGKVAAVPTGAVVDTCREDGRLSSGFASLLPQSVCEVYGCAGGSIVPAGVPKPYVQAQAQISVRALFRRIGLWRSIRSLSGARPEECKADLFAAVGLDQLTGYASRFSEICDRWSALSTLGGATTGSSNSIHNDIDSDIATSLSSFMQSSSFHISTLQEAAHADMLRENVAPSKLSAETYLIKHFGDHWREKISCTNVEAKINISSNKHAPGSGSTETQDSAYSAPFSYSSALRVFAASLRTVTELLLAFLSTEYDPSEGGWRSGLSGDAQRLSVKLANRLEVGSACLRKLNISSSLFYVSSSLGAVLPPSVQWLHYSSLSSGRKLMDCAGFVDHCMRHIFTSPDFSFEGENETMDVCTDADAAADEQACDGDAKEQQEQQQQEQHEREQQRVVLRKLHTVCMELVALLSLSSVETLVHVFVCSVRGLLWALRCGSGSGLQEENHASANKDCNENNGADNAKNESKSAAAHNEDLFNLMQEAGR